MGLLKKSFAFSSPQSIPDDATIIKGLQAGDEAMFDTIVDRYSGSLLRLAWPMFPVLPWRKKSSRRLGWGSLKELDDLKDVRHFKPGYSGF